ncbi:MAG: hypothetical protein FJ291_06095 [Planctomycetes bacterium]|nr:hypothetical protein [Planctomycetota bacterium]
MAQIVIRGIDDEIVSRLRRRAQRNGRSFQSEVKAILERAARVDLEAARELADKIRASFGGRKFDDSAEIIREERER